MRRFFLFILLCLLFPSCFWGQSQTLGLFQYEPGATDGYTLFGPGVDSTQYLIDNCGQVVHQWESDGRLFYSAKLLPDGRLLRVVYGDKIQLVNWDGSIDWEISGVNGLGQFHHDVTMMPNGHILAVASDRIHGDTALAWGRDPNLLNNIYLTSERIVEIAPERPAGQQIVWEWYLKDHLIQDFDSSKRFYGDVAAHPGRVDFNYTTFGGYFDFFHINTVEYDAKRDQILFTTRFFHEMYILDHSTTTAEAATESGGNSGKGGAFLYRYGNPAAYRAGDSTDQSLFGPHHVHVIPDSLPYAGKILVFNNGWQRLPRQSEILIFDHPADANGRYDLPVGVPPSPVNLAWRYPDTLTYDFFSEFVSGAQVLPNGNVLICEGAYGGIREIDTQKQSVWNYVNPHAIWGPAEQGSHIPFSQNFIFRAIKYPPDYPPFRDKDLSPKGKIELNPLPDNCRVTYSPPITYIPSELEIYPVPTAGDITLHFPAEENWVQIFSSEGKQVWQSASPGIKFKPVTETWRPGLYIVRSSSGASGKFILMP